MKSEITYFNLLYQIQPYITKSKLNNEFMNKYNLHFLKPCRMHCRQIGSSRWNGAMCYIISILLFSFSFLANEPLSLNNNDTILTLSHSLPYLAQVTSILAYNTSAIYFCFKRFVFLCLMFLMIQLLNSINTRLFKELTALKNTLYVAVFLCEVENCFRDISK